MGKIRPAISPKNLIRRSQSGRIRDVSWRDFDPDSIELDDTFKGPLWPRSKEGGGRQWQRAGYSAPVIHVPAPASTTLDLAVATSTVRSTASLLGVLGECTQCKLVKCLWYEAPLKTPDVGAEPSV